MQKKKQNATQKTKKTENQTHPEIQIPEIIKCPENKKSKNGKPKRI